MSCTGGACARDSLETPITEKVVSCANGGRVRNPAMDCGLPANTCATNSGKTLSPSPEHTASMNGKLRSVAAPISPSQFAPPKTITKCGKDFLSSLASVREARCCWNVEVKPTILTCCHATWDRQ